jgi:periplasmic copper chaperone A
MSTIARSRTFPARLAIVSAAVVALVLGFAASANAHVTVSSSSTAPGAEVTLTFKVPTESDTASTTGLTVELPSDPPFTGVLTQAVPGWTVKTVSTKLATSLKDDDGNTVTSAITKVIWTATAGGIKPGGFGTFALSVGPLPTSGTLYLPAVQHYSDGTDVSWVQQAQGSAEPEHPAPSVVIAAPVAATSSSGSGDGWAVGLAIAAIVIALIAAGLGGAALARSRRGPASAHAQP